MGNIINPTTFRLGWTQLWVTQWVSPKSYAYLWNNDYSLLIFLRSVWVIISKLIKIQRRLIYYTGARIFRTVAGLTLVLYLKDPRLQFLMRRFVRRSSHTTTRLVGYLLFKRCLSVTFFEPLRRILQLVCYRVATPKNLQIFFNIRQSVFDTAAGIAQFIKRKLLLYYGINYIIKRISNYIRYNLLRSGHVIGCKIEYSGRVLHGRGRSVYKWLIQGRVPLSTISAPISFASEEVILKYSLCGIKVWIYYNGAYLQNNGVRLQ